jgi:DNA polymerase-3 subunit delta
MTTKIEPAVVLLLGKERFLKEETVREIRSRWIKDDFQKGFNDTVVRGKEASLAEILDTANTMPMMGEKRVVTVFDFDENKKARELFEAYPEPSESAILILVSGEGEFYKVLDKKFQAKFTETYGSKGLIRNYYDMRPAEVRSWIVATAAKDGKRFTPDALDKLVETAGSSLSDLWQEIRKMSLFAPDKQEYDEDDVSRIVSRDLDASMDAVRDAVLRRDAAGALAEFRRFIARFGRGECLPLLGDLARQFRLMSRAHAAVRKDGASLEEIGRRPDFGLRHPATRDKFFGAMRTYSEQEVDRGLLMFYPMDRILKSKKDDEVKAYFERFLLSLCGRNKGRATKAMTRG